MSFANGGTSSKSLLKQWSSARNIKTNKATVTCAQRVAVRNNHLRIRRLCWRIGFRIQRTALGLVGREVLSSLVPVGQGYACPDQGIGMGGQGDISTSIDRDV